MAYGSKLLQLSGETLALSDDFDRQKTRFQVAIIFAILLVAIIILGGAVIGVYYAVVVSVSRAIGSIFSLTLRARSLAFARLQIF